MNEFKCPYCQKATNPANAKVCFGCGTAFPWQVVDESIKDMIKERETSILRGTVTLIDELYQSYKEKRPINFAAVKGFLSAYFFNRIVLVVGSIIGVLAVAVQTVVIMLQYRQINEQNELINLQNQKFDRQNTFVAFEQTVGLRNLLYKNPIDTVYKIMSLRYTGRDFDYIRLIGIGDTNRVIRWPRPNPSAIGQIAELAEKEPELIIPALKVLAKDEAKSVATAAVEILAGLKNLNTDLVDSTQKPYSTVIDLSGGDLEGANLDGFNLSYAKLNFMILTKTSFKNSILKDADIVLADLEWANFSGAYLRGAQFLHADLDFVNLEHTNLEGSIRVSSGKVKLA